MTACISTQLQQSVFCRLASYDQLNCIEIQHPQFSALLSLQGAQLLKFAPKSKIKGETKDEQNWLWLSELAEFKSGQSLRGGIPICWPWFGNAGKNPKAVRDQFADINQAGAHGFARSSEWQLMEMKESCEQVHLTLSFSSEQLSEQQRQSWQGKAQLTAEFIFQRGRCTLSLTTTNLDTKPLAFSQALHTYLPANIDQARIDGLQGCVYYNALIERDGQWLRQRQNGLVRFQQEVDRVYLQAKPRPITLHNGQGAARGIQANSYSCVVWNPWIDKAKRLSQFDPISYQQMLCIETANVMGDAVTLASGAQHQLTLILS